MPAHIYIAPWEWQQTEDFTGWARPNDGRLIQDLRSYGQCAQRGGMSGYGLFVYRTQQVIPGAAFAQKTGVGTDDLVVYPGIAETATAR